MWKVIQTRFIRGSSQNFPNELGQFTRKRQAMGEVKHQLKSHMDMLIKHEAPEDFVDCIVNDGESFKSVAFTDDKGIFYSVMYEAIEFHDEPKVPKFNLLEELRMILDDYEEFSDEPGQSQLFGMIYEDIRKLVERTGRK